MTKQLNIFDGAAAKKAGIDQAVKHADQMAPGWSDRAYKLLKEFLSVHVGPFMTEEVRSYAAMVDFPLPPSARAWGAVTLRAVREGIIERRGYGKVRNVKAHQANAAIWVQVRKTA